MKKNALACLYSLVGLVLASELHAQRATPVVSAADRAWSALQIPAAAPSPAKDQSADPTAQKAILSARAASFAAKADQARNFYTQYPGHAKAGQARLTEVEALVGATQAGDATVEGRLATTIQSLRGDKSIAPEIRVQMVAAYGFSHQMRGRKTHEERLEAIEQVARGLAFEFPDQPQGYESLLTIAGATGDDVRAKKIARELAGMPSPPAVKEGAQKLLARFDLVGKPLGPELAGANEIAAKATLKPELPTLVYSWTTASRGSLALAADLKKLGVKANIIGLNLDTDAKAAGAVAAQEGLIGTLVYDERGREGALAQRLKIRNPAQLFLVDAQGIIRDVRGESGLKNKLQQLGL